MATAHASLNTIEEDLETNRHAQFSTERTKLLPRSRSDGGRGYRSIGNIRYKTTKRSVSDNTSNEIHHCISKVFEPYNKLMKLIGWANCCKAETCRHPCCVKILNMLYVVLIVGLLLTGDVLSVLTCFCRSVANIGPPQPLDSDSLGVPANSTVYICKDHIFSRYIVIDILHFVAYFATFYTLRFASEPGELVKCLQEASMITMNMGGQFQVKAKRILSWSLGGAFAWILLAAVGDALHLYSQYDELYQGVVKPNWLVCVALFLSMTLLNVMYMAVVIYYTSQCCIMKFFTECIIQNERQMSLTFYGTMQRCNVLSDSIDKMNKTTGVAVSIVLVNLASFAVLAITSITTPMIPESLTIEMYASTLISAVLWCFLFAAPILSAANLTSRCSKLRKFGQKIRTVRGDKELWTSFDVEQAETASEAQPNDVTLRVIRIDAHASYISSLNLSAKIFLLPIRTGYVLSVTLLAGLIILLMFQLDIFKIWIGNNVPHKHMQIS